MTTPQIWLLVLLGVLIAAAAVITLAVVRYAPRSRAADLLGRGAFTAAREAGGDRPEDRLAAATAARHLLDLDGAAALLDAALADDPEDGEVLLERGLVEAYAGHDDAAADLLRQAASARADLAESITLHLAWLELRRGRHRRALRRFEEVEASLESKLRADLGGDPLFAEWFLQSALLWRAAGDDERATWAWREGLAAAPASRLAEALTGNPPAAGPLAIASGLSHRSDSVTD